MSEKPKFRISARFKEIFEVLQIAKKSKKNFLWRTEKRDMIPILIHQINPEENTVEASIESDARMPFKLKDELYIKLDVRDSAFKTKIQSIEDHRLTLEFPDEMVLSEKRREPRFYFQPADEKVVHLKHVREIVASVADICQTGFALIFGPDQKTSLKVKDRVILEAIGDYPMSTPITGEVVFKMTGSHGTKVGIHLDRKIPKTAFERFIVRDQFFDISDEQIVRDKAFRKLVGQQKTQAYKILRSKKKFQNLFFQLGLKQPEYQYLMEHIHLLCEVMCGLGITLGWVTEVTMDKLIYIAYLHDARYFSLPKLAKIPSLKEFEKIKQDLTEDEQEQYLEGPKFAADLALQNVGSDIGKILIQQKELPNGSGFPSGITASQLQPLSCLFITSHFFVDYVLATPDWSVDDFIKTNQKLLKGQHFTKIFRAMLA